MTKAVLEFDLNDPSDAKEHKRAVKATGLYCAIHEFEQHLRLIMKHRELNTEESKLLDEVFAKLHLELDNHDINLDGDLE